MPIDRNTPNTLKPKLASNRTAKTPLTPRLAVAPSASAVSSPQSNRTVRSNNGAPPRVNIGAQENVTPVKAFLGSNITPRSSARKSRVGFESPPSTPNDTPSSTPVTSRPTSTIGFPQREHGFGNIEFGFLDSQNGVRPRSIPGQSSSQTTPTPRLPLSNINSSVPAQTGAARDGSPLFFHASDARPREQAPPQKKAPVFFYANGKQDDISPRNEGPSSPAQALGTSQRESKFFHADTVAGARSQPSLHTLPPVSASPEPLDPDTSQGASLRSPSPTKGWAHLPNRSGTSQGTRPAIVSRTSGQSAASGANITEVLNPSRRSSAAASTIGRGGHMKSASLSSIESVTEWRMKTSNDLSAITPSPLHTEHRIVSTGSLADSVASAPSPSFAPFSGFSSPTPTSPIKAANSQSALEMMNELAANARRERKVLDLEISNSSLLAINRSLEKEVRKQKTELRRFRRMSRAGRFSMDTMDTIDATETYSVGGASDVGDLSNLSEENEEEEPQEEEEEEDSDSSLDESQLSPSAQAERDETRRIRDEKRLQLDLAKHRELLIDSQKMNQSLKRCMNWTEQLIKDGQKAIEYKVHVSDVKLGGRVLVAEDEHEDEPLEESRGLLSPWSPVYHTAMDALESPFFPDLSRNLEHDSGVDVDGLKPALEPPDDITPLASPFEDRIQRLYESIAALEAS